MHTILKYYEKLLTLFRRKKSEQYINNQNDILSQLIFSLKSDLKISLEIITGDKNQSIEEDYIVLLGEKIAELILLINSGYFKGAIVPSLIEQKNKNINDPQHVLLIDNIIIFYNLLSKTINNHNSSNSVNPSKFIKPSEVFKTS
jgi:hypothetical protein